MNHFIKSCPKYENHFFTKEEELKRLANNFGTEKILIIEDKDECLSVVGEAPVMVFIDAEIGIESSDEVGKKINLNENSFWIQIMNQKEIKSHQRGENPADGYLTRPITLEALNGVISDFQAFDELKVEDTQESQLSSREDSVSKVTDLGLSFEDDEEDQELNKEPSFQAVQDLEVNKDIKELKEEENSDILFEAQDNKKLDELLENELEEDLIDELNLEKVESDEDLTEDVILTKDEDLFQKEVMGDEDGEEEDDALKLQEDEQIDEMEQEDQIEEIEGDFGGAEFSGQASGEVSFESQEEVEVQDLEEASGEINFESQEEVEVQDLEEVSLDSSLNLDSEQVPIEKNDSLKKPYESEESEDFYDKINIIEEEKKTVIQENLSLKAQLEDLKIESKSLIKRYEEELDDVNLYVKELEHSKNISDERLKSLKSEFDKLGEQVRIDIGKVKRREKELEGQMEMMLIDSQSQVKSRDLKIFDLKRKIDQLEFNMENTAIRNQNSREDKVKLEEKVNRIMRTLRGSIKMLEEDSSVSGEELINKIDELN